MQRAAEFLPPEPGARAALEALAPLVQQRVRTLAEVPDMIAFLWQDRPELDEPAWQKATRDPRSADMLRLAAAALERSDWTAEAVEEAVRGAATPAGYVGEGGNVQLSKAQAPIRVALTGPLRRPAAVGVDRRARPRAHARPPRERPGPPRLVRPAGSAPALGQRR